MRLHIIALERDVPVGIASEVIVTLVDARGGTIRLGIDAPREYDVSRLEGYFSNT